MTTSALFGGRSPDNDPVSECSVDAVIRGDEFADVFPAEFDKDLGFPFGPAEGAVDLGTRGKPCACRGDDGGVANESDAEDVELRRD